MENLWKHDGNDMNTGFIMEFVRTGLKGFQMSGLKGLCIGAQGLLGVKGLGESVD